MKLGMTGNRNGITNEAKAVLIDFINNNKIDEIHHGDCVGADKDFHDVCAEHKLKIVIHPPNDAKMRAFCVADVILPEQKYLDRNHNIVDDADVLIAFPSTKKETVRSGTWGTIRYARKKKKQIIVVFSDGTCK